MSFETKTFLLLLDSYSPHQRGIERLAANAFDGYGIEYCCKRYHTCCCHYCMDVSISF